MSDVSLAIRPSDFPTHNFAAWQPSISGQQHDLLQSRAASGGQPRAVHVSGGQPRAVHVSGGIDGPTFPLAPSFQPRAVHVSGGIDGHAGTFPLAPSFRSLSVSSDDSLWGDFEPVPLGQSFAALALHAAVEGRHRPDTGSPSLRRQSVCSDDSSIGLWGDFERDPSPPVPPDARVASPIDLFGVAPGGSGIDPRTESAAIHRLMNRSDAGLPSRGVMAGQVNPNQHRHNVVSDLSGHQNPTVEVLNAGEGAFRRATESNTREAMCVIHNRQAFELADHKLLQLQQTGR